MTLYILGTSHIAAQSVQEIRKSFSEFKPDLVAVELDLGRAQMLLSGQTSKIGLSEILRIGVKGYLFAKIGQIVQQKLGKSIGVSPGTEMKTAMELARKENLKLFFIDQPIKTTLRNFSKEFTWKEKFRFLRDILRGIFLPRKQTKLSGLENLDLSKVPDKELIGMMMKQLKARYPSLYKTLVEDRNKYMVKQIVKLLRENKDKKILVVVGAGHKEGMEELLLKVDVL